MRNTFPACCARADIGSPPTTARQLTVMFCDLVGSTALSARLDPEDLRDVIGAYHRAVAEIVAGFDSPNASPRSAQIVPAARTGSRGGFMLGHSQCGPRDLLHNIVICWCPNCSGAAASAPPIPAAPCAKIWPAEQHGQSTRTGLSHGVVGWQRACDVII